MDRQDSSVTRPMWLFRRIFDKANLECYRQVKQRHFPKGLYSVYMFVLKPRKVKDILEQESIGKYEVHYTKEDFEIKEVSSIKKVRHSTNKNAQEDTSNS